MNCFLLIEVEVGAPNDCCAAFVGCFDDKVILVLRFLRAVHSSLERLESLVLQLDFSLRTSWQHFLMK